MAKSSERLKWLARWTPAEKGTYVCPVPGCKHKQSHDGFCSAHPAIPLRLTKPKA